MSSAPRALVIDFLEWLAARPRPYAEVMEVWRTNCPRLTVWEDALDEGLAARRALEGAGVVVELTPAGRVMLAAARGGANEDRDPGRLVRHT
jgi:hypothetical protein